MAFHLNEDHLSDEEVFFGKLSLKEIKKHILWNNPRKIKCATSNDDSNNDIKIIETHSAPDLIQRDNIINSDVKPVSCTSLSPPGPEVYSDWDVKPVDDSFIKVEKMVADLCVSPEKVVKKGELNNTLDIIDYILKNGAPNTNENGSHVFKPLSDKHIHVIPKVELSTQDADCVHSKTPSKNLKLKSEQNVIHNSPRYFTPAKVEMNSQKSEKFLTPSSCNLKQKTPIFKTPANPLSSKKSSATSLKKTPIKTSTYQHIASPVASYIKNCPVAPLVKEVRPTKPLPGISSIPKFVKNPATNKPSNKENVNLPSVAYKSAKKMQVIEMPDEEKLPQTQLMKKITSSLPKPRIMKHNHREINLAKRVLGSRQEDSFADLSLQQADVSVCTQKSAFNKPKKAL